MGEILAGENQDEHGSEEEVARTTEPDRMSWFVFLFMAMCVFMTLVMTYYAWGVFQDAV